MNMLEKGKISALQMGVMMIPTVLATGFLVQPTLSAMYAKNDFWMTGLLASVSGLLSIYIAIRLHRSFPKQTVIEYSGHLIGSIAGKLIGLAYFLYFLHATGAVVRAYAEFVSGSFLFKTPVLLVITSMILLCAFAVRGGIEMLARSAVIFTPIFMLPIFFLLLLIPELDPKNMLPLLNHGISPVLKGTILPQSWVSEFFLVSFFLPHLSDPGKGAKWCVFSLCAVIASMTFVNLIVLFLLGPDTSNKTYPVLIAFRYIRIGGFFENMEALLLAMWVVGNFVKIGVFYYAAVISFSQWMKLADYRPVVFPLGIFTVIFSIWDLPNFPKFGHYLGMLAPLEISVILLFIPLCLYIADLLRKRRVPDR